MTGGDDFGLRTEATFAAEAGAAIATFLLGFPPPSALRILFFAPGSAIFVNMSPLSSTNNQQKATIVVV